MIVQCDSTTHQLERDPLVVRLVAFGQIHGSHSAVAGDSDDSVRPNPSTLCSQDFIPARDQRCHILGSGLIEKAVLPLCPTQPTVQLGAELRRTGTKPLQKVCSLICPQLKDLVQE